MQTFQTMCQALEKELEERRIHFVGFYGHFLTSEKTMLKLLKVTKDFVIKHQNTEQYEGIKNT